MSDHRGTRRRGPNIVGVRDLKTHAAGILRHVREARASYILTHRGHAVGMILPLEPSSETDPLADESAAWEAFVRSGRQLERRFRPGLSGVRLLSSTRR